MKLDSIRKPFNLKLSLCDPTGILLNSGEISINIVTDPNSMLYFGERLFIEMGEYRYLINKTGKIIEEWKN